MSSADTIVAAATPPGRGGIGIVRISGAKVPDIARGIVGELPPPRVASSRDFLAGNGELLDSGLVLYFPAPQSFTGEHVLELHGHGGPVVMDQLVQRALELGARAAQPGEFTQRAFLNDKLDLAQAEAIADLIDSGSAQAARAALRSLQGEFSAMVQGLNEALTDLRTYVEAAIDFPEEEIDFLADAELTHRIDTVLAHFDGVARAARQGQLLRDGITVVIAGAPNAGKSSLLNRLAGYDAAIVTDIPGTTRDVLRERIDIDGLPLHVIDTAGLRESGNIVETEGVRRARAELTRADRILFVVDAAADPEANAFEGERDRLPPGLPITVILNKSDRVGREPSLNAHSVPPRIWMSALTGAGLELLRAHLKSCVGFAATESGNVSARRRHLDALARARQHVDVGREQLRARRAGELMAEELRQAQAALGEITGEITSDELLGRIFATFCIGK
ncbi:MAG TPA: tRNA uridine-5-carboxymethylaminomethyl(34) synthesis GTPase MnmE [Steroidobacteraceae bacterium]|nr:tRNA uridine-5-carboxymethylaminomethyl(34) synthesis GTPase MnmE [Steroidobacteraceae bacterium]